MTPAKLKRKYSHKATRLFCTAFLMLLLTVIVSCKDQPWSTETSVVQQNTFSNGVVVTVTQEGLSTYSDEASGLLSKFFGGYIAISIPLTKFVESTPPVFFGGDPENLIVFTPLDLSMNPLPGANTVSLTVAFKPLPMIIPLSGGGGDCTVTAVFDEVRFTAELNAGRDLLGNISLLMADDTVSTVIEDIKTVASKACDGMDASRLSSSLNLVRITLEQAIHSHLNDAEFVGQIDTLAATLLGTMLPGLLVIDVPSASGSPATYIHEMKAMSEDGKEPVVIVTEGGVVTPLRVGVQASIASCVQSLPIPSPVPPPTKPVLLPSLQGESGHVVVDVREDFLQAGLIALLKSGLLCFSSGFEQPSGLTVGDIDPLVDDDLSALDKNTVVSIRLIPGAIPQMSLSDSAKDGVLVSLSLPATTVELYVRQWGAEWLISQFQWDLVVSDLILTLADKSAPALQLTGGVVTVSNSKSAIHDQLATLVFNEAIRDLTLLSLPSVYPYPLTNGRFSRDSGFISMRADFDTTYPPQIAQRFGAVHQAERADDVGPEMACSQVGSGRSAMGKRGHIPTWLWLQLAIVFATMVFWRVRTRQFRSHVSCY
jgi:hypothetical protein